MKKNQELCVTIIPSSVLTDDRSVPDPTLLYNALFPATNIAADFRATCYIKVDDFVKCVDTVLGEDVEYCTVFELVDTVRLNRYLVFPKHKLILDLVFSTGDTDQDRIRMAQESVIDDVSGGMEWVSVEKLLEEHDEAEARTEEEVIAVAPYTRHEEFNIIVGMQVYSSVNDPVVDKLLAEYDKYKYPEIKVKTKDAVFTLGSGSRGLTLNKHYLNNESYGPDIIEHNYNDDFKPAYDRLLEFLSNDESGLVLFKGEPGTGKSSLLIHLTSISEELGKKVVFVPSAFAGVLTDPNFLTFATKQLGDSILILEDAEEALLSRNGNHGGAVTNILNISDGILGKILKVKVIATINKADSVDAAVFRKGRLKIEYTFHPLAVDKANKLLEILGSEKTVSAPTTLANVYNIEYEPKMNDITPTKTMGFGR